MLNISNDEIRVLVPMEDAIECMKNAFSDFDSGDFIVPDRISTEIDGGDSTVLVMPAYRNGGKYFTIKTVTVAKSSGKNNSGLISACVNIFDSSNGDMIATLGGDTITSLRTGAATGLATRLLAKKDSKIGAIFGTGVQAKTQVEAMAKVRQIKKVYVYGRETESMEKFSRHISDDYGIEAISGNLEDLSKVDIICTATPSADALFKNHHLKPGVHINAIGSFRPSMREIPNETVINAKVVVDSFIASKKEAGDLLLTEQETNWTFKNIHSEIGAIASGRISGRSNDVEMTLFKSVGLGFQDLAISELVLDRYDC